MAEETEGQDTGAEAVAGGADPAAVALALNGASQKTADAFLNDQRALIADQRHHLHEQLKQLHLGLWEKRLGVLLRVATAAMGLAIAAGLGFMVWDASQSSGLLIEPFSVPPDLVQRGITGQVVAAKLLDRLVTLQAETISQRAIKTYTNSWDQNGIKLDIPETGVSLGDLDEFLREKLGHDTRITGETIRTASGLSLTARTGAEGAVKVTGSEADFEGLVQQLGASVYLLTQPFRYAVYLAEHDRYIEAIPILKPLAKTGSRLDRAYSNALWGRLSGQLDGISTSQHLLRRAVAAEPDNILAHYYLADVLCSESLPEQCIREFNETLSVAASTPLEMFSNTTLSSLKQSYHHGLDYPLGDFKGAAQSEIAAIQSLPPNAPQFSSFLAWTQARMHDLTAARATLIDTANYRTDLLAGFTALNSLRARMQIDSEAENWAAVSSDADGFSPLIHKYPGLRSYSPTITVPLLAYAETKLGKIAEAEAQISATPADCYDCLITRARIAELRGQHGRADYWFALAIDGQKSIPFAYSYWGQALMARGDLNGAITKFTIANQVSPHFADPLEGWGEALMAKNQSHLALAKFGEADKYAPNWGRLHLKWGEALGYTGRKDEARAQYRKASMLGLTPAEKAELAKVTALIIKPQ